MVCRIEIALKPVFSDPNGSSLHSKMQDYLKINTVHSVRVVDAYSIDHALSEEELLRVSQELLCDPVNQHFSINSPCVSNSNFSFAISVGFKPGVKDNVGGTAREAIEELLGIKLSGNVYTSKHYLLSGKVARADAEKIARELLANELIQCFEVKSASEFGTDGFGVQIQKMDIAGGGLVKEIDLNVSDKRLIEISKQRLLALSLDEMRAAKAYFTDPEVIQVRKSQGMPAAPTDVEIEVIAQTWSEHCKHKIFNAKISMKSGKKKRIVDSIFKSFVKAATHKLSKKKKWLVSVFTDNAGIIEFVPGWNVAMKVETHNSPSALDPYGGALTGILGVNRDILGCGMGAKPIFNTDVFCFADPRYSGEIPPRLFHPRRVLEGVRAGVAAGGNASGIPTVNGSLYFDDKYLGKPLVYCGTGGLMPAQIGEKKTHEKAALPGDRIFMVGGRIGKDGIHGATFSSQELHEGSPVSAVQLGDPYTQKKMVDFLLEARDLGLYNAITDNGAGGLSSSIGEMAQTSGGCILHLDRAPLKYPGLDPWEIFVSESQERMSVAVPPSKAGQFVQLARLRNVEVSDLGEFTASGRLHIMYGAKTVAYLEMNFLHNGLPQLELDAELRAPSASEPKKPESADLNADLLLLLTRPNICSKEYVIRQYDHEVQGSSVVKPLCGRNSDGPSDAGVISPLFDRKEGLVISNGLCPRFSSLDAYQMAANAADEAVRNYVAAGGSLERVALLDNFCWSDPIYSSENPEGKHKLAQLVRSCEGLYDACLAYGAPLISGKDSMKNDYRHGKWRISIPPTLLVSAIGRIEDASLAMTSDFKNEGDSIYILGKTLNELGASEYYAMKGQLGANVPKVEFRRNFALYSKLQSAIEKGLVASCHDCSEGGLAVALSESCIAGAIGASVSFQGKHGKGLTPTQLMFSESAGRFIVSVKKKDEVRFKAVMRGSDFEMIGEVRGNALEISLNNSKLVSQPMESLRAAWKKTMGW
ncbi:MAG: phosphoribosylformylglycinamidine synthase subunit PurL [Candidatus Micrarchaeota archaeon]|nr:phosphoribosylformylglycinamidine synthase subunit PurL [Candidatus Micrarchaeota archaeon]